MRPSRPWSTDLLSDLSIHAIVNITKTKLNPKRKLLNLVSHRLQDTQTMPRRRASVAPSGQQVQALDPSMYIPRPIPDDMMSITTNQLEEDPDRQTPEEYPSPYDDEENRPQEFSPRLWQLFNRIQRRGTEPLFPADWQVHLSS
jgi:hypothetical protein